MLISELSQKTGVSKDTLRFYEKAGLLNSTNKRGENNYRNYDDEAVSRLEFIKHGKSLGCTLSEIRKTMDEWDRLSTEDKAQIVRVEGFENWSRSIVYDLVMALVKH